MNRKKFEQLVRAGIEDVPKRFLEKLDNVAIVIEDEPALLQNKKLGMRRGSTLLGLYPVRSLRKSFYSEWSKTKIGFAF